MTSEYKIIYRDSANEDLLEIIDYIERMTFSKERAEKFSYELVSEIIKLMFFPYMFQVLYKDFRSFSVKNKRIFYKIYEDKKEVVIFRILGGFQKYEDYL